MMLVWVALVVFSVIVGGEGRGEAVVTPSLRGGTAASYHWQNVNITAGGFVDGILFHPKQKDVYYVRTDIGGPYRRDPTTNQWIPLLDFLGPSDYFNMGMEGLAVDPNDPNLLYAAVGMYIESWAPNGAIFRSHNQGRTWQRSDLTIKLGGNNDGRFAGERLVVDPNFNSTLYFGSRQDGLWKSGDGAVTWSKVSSFPVTGPTNGIGVIFVLFDSQSGRAGSPTPVIYVGASQQNGIYRSTDAGKSWSTVPGQPTAYLPNRAEIIGSYIYVTYGSAPGPNGMSAGAVYRFDIGSGVWTDISPAKGSSGFGYAGLSVDRSNPKVLMVSTMDRWATGDTIFRSLDAGVSWHDIGPSSSRDISGSPWITFGKDTAPLGWWIGALAIDPFRPGHVLYGTGATIWESTDVDKSDSGQPTHWFIGAEGVEETAVISLISPPAGASLLSGLGDIGGFRHDDFNVSPPKGMYTNPYMSNVDSLDFVEKSPLTILRVGRGAPSVNGAISRDGGSTWSAFSSSPGGDGNTNSIAASPDGSIFVWTHGTNVPPSYSTDGGRTWTTSQGAPNGLNVISDRAQNYFYGYSTDGTVYVSKDGARTFQVGSRGLPTGKGQLKSVSGFPGHLWLSAGNSWDSSAGLFHSNDSAASFQKVPSTSYVECIGLGKAPTGSSYPALYIQGIAQGGPNAIYRSDNIATSWVRINDDLHQYGGADHIIGDPRVYGRVFIGTNGRGIIVGYLTQ